MVEALRRTMGGDVQCIETHISFVLLGAGLAYKLKKALNPGFLDFTRLALRRHFCAEELRLNRRLAPDLYLDVVPVTEGPAGPVFGGAGPAIDFAVRMRAFSQDGLWDRMAARGALRAVDIDALAGLMHRFHRDALVADALGPWGSPEQVRQPMAENLQALDQLLTAAEERARLSALRRWEAATYETLRPVFAERLRAGHVREGHGDLHLGNVAQIDGRTTVFDCIEFNPGLRWIDVISEIAFMAMDLMAHGLADLGHRFVNAYLERSGDYAGVRVLRYYLVHRALVRAKVAALRSTQLAPTGATHAAQRYLDLAVACSHSPAPALMITHGLSGSGKTTLTQGLLESAGAIRIRADVERKRLFGLDAMARSGASLNAGLYSGDASAATYARLLDLAAAVLAGGRHVVLDATFLRRAQRDAARGYAAARRLRFVILDFDVEVATLRERVTARTARGDDASEAGPEVLAEQLCSAEPLAADEQPFVFRCAPLCDDAHGVHRADWSVLLGALGFGELPASREVVGPASDYHCARALAPARATGPP